MSTTASRALERASLVELLANAVGSSKDPKVAALRKTRLARLTKLDAETAYLNKQLDRRVG